MSATRSAKAREPMSSWRRAIVLLTPPLASGLLPGTLRARLLAEGRAREEYLSLEDFEGREFFMGNSVRGLVRATLL